MKRFNFPHPMNLLLGCILVAAALTWILPAGQYDRTLDEATGRTVVVPGTFQNVDRNPVNLFEAAVAIPRGLIDAADVVFLVLLVGGAFTVVDATGAFGRGMSWLVGKLGGRDLLVIPVICVLFATGGALLNMQEEIIALIPTLLILVRTVGFTPLVAVAMSAGAAFVGSAFSPVNPFQVQIAQKLAQLPLLSGGGFRLAFLFVAVGFWIWTTMRFAKRSRVQGGGDGEASGPSKVATGDAGGGAASQTMGDPLTNRDIAVLSLVLVTFAVLVWGLLAQGWDFNAMSALFLIMALLAGAIGRLGFEGTAAAYIRGFQDMAFAAVLIGLARAISVVMEDGLIVDTIVRGMFRPVESFPAELSALGMMVSHIGVHVPVPSVSGHAVLTMPVLVPLSDLLGISRQVTVLAYQMGGGLTDIMTPTNGALMAILASAGVGYNDWFKFAFPRYIALLGIGAASILLAIQLGI